jgi:hypothetical protein
MELTTANMATISDEGAELTIRDPLRALTDWVITCRGKDSDAYRKRMEAGRKRLSNKKGTPDYDQISATATDSLAACVIGWRGITVNGAEWPCTPENIREVLTNPEYAWVAEQIDEFIADRANFYKGAESD